jgi:DNA-directed RNA polymerase specialized sigma24 family protein
VEAAARATLSNDLARLKDGDRAASRPVFDALWPALLAFARRSLDDDRAQEAAQRALVRLFGQVDRYDIERDALSWAFALTVWEVRSMTRDASRAQARTGRIVDDVIAACDAPDDLVIDRELRLLLDDVLATMSDNDRRAIVEMLQDADPQAPLSARLRQRRHRALAKLRTMWKELHGTP